MDHQRITAEGIVDRYLSGDLTPDETTAFEQHYMDCPECLDELADTQRLREGLHDLVESGELALPADRATGFFQSPVWAMAATVLLGVSLVATGLMYREVHRMPEISAGAADVHALVSVRAGPSGTPVNVITPRGDAQLLVLLVDPGTFGDPGPFTVTITAEGAGARPLTTDPLAPGADEQLAVTLPAGSLPAGDYRVDIRKSGADTVLNSLRFRLQASH